KFVGEVPWRLYSSTYPAYCFIVLRSPADHDFIEKLCARPETQHVAGLLGNYHLYVAIHAASFSETIRAIDEIQGSNRVSDMIVAPALQIGLKASAWRPHNLDSEREEAVTRIFQNTPRSEICYDDFEQSGDVPGELEKKVVSLLQQNCRIAASEIATMISKSAHSAQRLIDRVAEKGWYRPRIEVPLHDIGYGTAFVAEIDTEPQHTESVLEKITAHYSSRLVAQVAGNSDIHITGAARSRRHLADILNREFSQFEGIEKTRTHIISHDYKRFWITRGAKGQLLDFKPLALK
ncbi:MAG: Lrp/AsnC family transcriptional regulator, partial [Corynebacterium sp.]|nr:Lrp/AsnC family transcriptional regulator [Corynebacterium sp.]